LLTALFYESRFFIIFIGLTVDLALIFFAVQSVAPSRRVTYYAFYLAMLIPLAMITGLIVLLTSAIPTFSMPGNDDFYVMREGMMFLIMGVTFVYSLVALQKGFQAKRMLQAPLQ
jgi:thiosulfate reductase cytochrome b subunit